MTTFDKKLYHNATHVTHFIRVHAIQWQDGMAHPLVSMQKEEEGGDQEWPFVMVTRETHDIYGSSDIEPRPKMIHPNDWIVIHGDDTIEVMSHITFIQRFVPVELEPLEDIVEDYGAELLKHMEAAEALANALEGMHRLCVSREVEAAMMNGCGSCHKCLNRPDLGFLNPINLRMIVCKTCGSKRCSRAADHDSRCVTMEY